MHSSCGTGGSGVGVYAPWGRARAGGGGTGEEEGECWRGRRVPEEEEIHNS